MSNPKPRHTTGGSGRSGGTGRGGAGRRQVGSPRRRPTLLPSRASYTTVLNDSSEARTNEILCKSAAEQNLRLTTGLPAGPQSALRSWLLTKLRAVWRELLFMEGASSHESGGGCLPHPTLSFPLSLNPAFHPSAQGVSGFWLNGSWRIPGHALHEKGLQRQKGVVPLVGSLEQRALLVPVINR